MRTKYGFILLIVLVGVITSFSGCDNTDDPTEQDRFMEKLKGEWTLAAGHVTVGSVDVTGSFDGMKITVDKNRSYNVTNPVSPIWPVSGVFSLEPGGAGLFNLKRDDGVLITITELTATMIKFQMPYTSPNGRSKSVSGQYEFAMNR